jgi:hypothetical protein
VFEKQFSTSPEVHAIVGLVLDPGSGPLKACAVTVTPQAIKTTLGAVLTAAAGGASSPAGCVGTFSSAKGKITAIDGQPSPAEPRWQLSVDGGAGKAARLSSPIHLGDTVALKLG